MVGLDLKSRRSKVQAHLSRVSLGQFESVWLTLVKLWFILFSTFSLVYSSLIGINRFIPVYDKIHFPPDVEEFGLLWINLFSSIYPDSVWFRYILATLVRCGPV